MMHLTNMFRMTIHAAVSKLQLLTCLKVTICCKDAYMLRTKPGQGLMLIKYESHGKEKMHRVNHTS